MGFDTVDMILCLNFPVVTGPLFWERKKKFIYDYVTKNI